MAKKIFVGNDNNIAKTPSKILVGNSSNVARKVTSIFVGNSSNQAVKVYPNSHGLPSAFQECEYVFNTGGTQYIDLGFKANSDTSILMDVMFTKSFPDVSSPMYNQPMFGVFKYGRSGEGYLLRQNTYYMYVYGNYVGVCFDGESKPGTFEYITRSLNRNKRYVLEIKNGSFIVNGSTIHTFRNTFGNTGANMLIFGGYVSQENQAFSLYKTPEGMQLYHFRAQNYDGTLIRDMYPCYMKSSSLNSGMYDLISTTFYGNSGSGYFDKGPNVE